jgi:hypothetical protein
VRILHRDNNEIDYKRKASIFFMLYLLFSMTYAHAYDRPTGAVFDETLISVIDQIKALKGTSMDQVSDRPTRITANARLAQAIHYYNIAVANYRQGKFGPGDTYLKLSKAMVKKYVAILERGIEKGKFPAAEVQSLIEAAEAICADIDYLLGEGPASVACPCSGIYQTVISKYNALAMNGSVPSTGDICFNNSYANGSHLVEVSEESSDHFLILTLGALGDPSGSSRGCLGLVEESNIETYYDPVDDLTEEEFQKCAEEAKALIACPNDL